MKRWKKSHLFLLCRRIATLALFSLTLCSFIILTTVQQVNLDETPGSYQDGGFKIPSLKISRYSTVGYQEMNQENHSPFFRKDQARIRFGVLEQPEKLRPSTFADNFAPQQWRFPFGCKEIKWITIVSELGHGYTKTVQKGLYEGREVAVKSIQPWNKDIAACVERGRHSEDVCFNLSKYKLVKEALLLQQLNHPNIVKLLGFCWQNELNSPDINIRGFTLVTELGEPMDLIKFVQMAWQQRFRVSLDLARLVHYMAHSPLGSLLIMDFRFQQFVLVHGVLKLTDLDDVDNKEPGCTTNEQCIVRTAKVNRSLPCASGRCKGFNVLKNLANICNWFLSHMLIPGAPTSLRSVLADLLQKLQMLQINSERLVQRLEHVMGILESWRHVGKGE